jgi:urocanate hydratase
VINGGFGMLLDGSSEVDDRIVSMLFYDVNNGIARRSWARNGNAQFAIEREMKRSASLKVTKAHLVDDELLEGLF